MAKLYMNLPKNVSYKKNNVPESTKIRRKYLILLGCSLTINIILTTLLYKLGYFN